MPIDIPRIALKTFDCLFRLNGISLDSPETEGARYQKNFKDNNGCVFLEQSQINYKDELVEEAVEMFYEFFPDEIDYWDII